MPKPKDHRSKVLGALQKKFGDASSRMAREGASSDVKEAVPTGIEVLDHYILGCGGVPVGRVGEIFSDEGAGKAQPVDEPVLTPSGWRPIGALKVGDEVIGVDGKATKVEGVFPQGRLLVYRVETSDGGTTRACGDHLWSVRTDNHDRRGQPSVVKTTRELQNDLAWKSGYAKWRLPIVLPVDLPKVDLPLDPYVLGALLGDGCLSGGAVISNEEASIIGKVVDLLPAADTGKWDGKYLRIRRANKEHLPNGALRASVTRSALRDLGLFGLRSHEKFVPEQYLLAGVDQRRELLRGLLDTDGHINKSSVEFSTASKPLADAVVWLSRSLGGIARLSHKKSPKYTYKGRVHTGRPAWRVSLRVPGKSVVSSTKHLASYKQPHSLHRRIVDISSDGEAECVCIKVAATDALYVTKDCIVTHNTSLGFAMLAAFQKAGGDAYFLETENALQASRMDAFGVDRDKLVLVEPRTLEDTLNAFKIIVEEVPGDRPTIILWDSLAATELEAQASADFGAAKLVGKRGKLMSEALPVLCTRAMNKRCAIVMINQLRSNIGVFFGDDATTPGGHAAKFQASWRLRLWKGGVYPKSSPEKEGHHVTVKAVKNKVGMPHRKAKVRLNYTQGWDNEWSLLELAKEKDVLSSKRAKVSEKTLLEARQGLKFPLPAESKELDDEDSTDTA